MRLLYLFHIFLNIRWILLLAAYHNINCEPRDNFQHASSGIYLKWSRVHVYPGARLFPNFAFLKKFGPKGQKYLSRGFRTSH